MNTYSINDNDKKILRDLAKKQYDYSQMPEMQELVKLWYDHNDLKGKRPMVTIELWTFLKDIPMELKCSSETGRRIEYSFNMALASYRYVGDDRVIPPFFPISSNSWFKPFGIDYEVKFADGSMGHTFVKKIDDLKEDLPHIRKSTYGVRDLEENKQYKEFLEDIFGDILPVKYISNCLYSVPTQNIVHVMGMEDMLYAMYDYPDEFHRLMDMLTDDYLEYYSWLEEQKLLGPTASYGSLAQGTYCFTRELPDSTAPDGSGSVKLNEVWGFMDSQETTGMSPKMFNEFIFPYYKKISDKFGLFSYGCCEAVDHIYDLCLSKCENLRKLSISPWCNEELMGEKLRGSKTIYHRKPSPNYLGVNKELDEAGWRNHVRKTLKAAKGCKLEFSQRDVYTLNGNLEKLRRLVEIVREEIEDCWD